MMPSAIRLVMLAVFSGLSMNLILQFGLGLKETALAGNPSISEDTGLDPHIGIRGLFAGAGVLFAGVLFLWLFFSFFRSFFFLGLLEYLLLFPASALVFSLFEYCTRVFILKKTDEEGEPVLFASSLAGGALTGAALFVTLNIAGTVAEAAVLSLGFSCGVALAVVIAGEIRRRSQMELVPEWLRGGPLVVIALGLLALVFSSGALMLFQVLGA